MKALPYLPVLFAALAYGFRYGVVWGVVGGFLTVFAQVAYAWVTCPMHVPNHERWQDECEKSDREFAAFLLICLTFAQALTLWR